ncbi:hypothetical protein O6H91_04G063900 [Diphasiastrum complanatum]|uniref:Uncharacterized protein n=2 Tax=Diphasiastrum complanatum TaxID=34168 RepID=A0ACC2DXJ5_DIPCM|nr:hypothetical protein O6H91_04G063900 [Diphasiastrum complanatum]KAJ7558978.1 hypothetical protein O6H91_04G063900 [Diphasiastrum complanatum]
MASSGSMEDLTAALESSCSTQTAASAENGPGISKKAAQKAAKKAERLQNRQAAAATAATAKEEDDPLGHNYGDLPLEDVQSKGISGRIWTKVSELDAALKERNVLIRGRAQSARGKGKIAFLIVREQGYTVQCVATVSESVSKGLVKYVTGLSKESIVDVEGVVSKPDVEIASTTQQVVEIQVRKVYCVSKAASVLPLNLEDAARSERDLEKAEKEGVQYVRVGQDTRLNNRVLDLRTPANQAIFRIQSYVSMLFRQYLLSEDFVEIHTPKLMAGASEGGSAVFKLDYKGQSACLAQSPQLHKQMAICADFGRVFEIGPVFRAEDSFTHRHLCEFTGLDLEMEIKEHYFEVLDLLGELFVSIFDGLNAKCKKELQAINQQYPFEPLQYLRKTLLLTFPEGVQMLKDAGVEVDPFGDLNTESERRLGQLVKEKYNTDFYVLHRYPLAVRPFYTMPAVDDNRYSNSFDVFIRGEEIISGAQRVHDPDLLVKRAGDCGIDVKTLTAYIDSFRWGTVPHGGAGVGLERVVMLFCALNNIRKSSLFPRDPQRLAP